MVRDDWATARAEGQRLRIVELLESLADAESKDQCRMCGAWYVNLTAHEPHCDGPDGTGY